MKESEREKVQNFIHVDNSAQGDGHIAWINPIPGIPNMVVGYGKTHNEALEDLRRKIEPVLSQESNKIYMAEMAIDIYRQLKYMQEVPISMWGNTGWA